MASFGKCKWVVPAVQQEPARTWKDALLTTKSGQAMVEAKIQAAASEKAAIGRIAQLRALVEYVFSHKHPACKTYTGYVFSKAEPRIRQLGRLGGAEYDKAVATLKYTWNGPESFRDTLKVLGC